MKRFFVSLAAVMLLTPVMKADEGMWLLPLLEKINSDAMSNLGSRLTPEQIYSVNNSSIKDAIVQFGGGCTGEIISGSGLLVTNHHCGYASIQALSTEDHNYLEDGYWAMNREEELPVPGLTVKFLQSMTDVSGKVKNEKAEKALIEAAEKENPNCSAQIVSFFNENVHYLVVYKIYRDVRFVGAPPAALGKFGGDTDNWMWPRHTCDFSMFRVYAGPDNEPADYSEDNVPFEPRQFLSISLAGVQEGDFALIMGYPGYTQRYQTAAQLEAMLETNDIRIAARGIRQDVLRKAMRADEKISLQYANKYANSSNGWKKWIGMKEAFDKLDVIGRQLEKETGLETWISEKRSRTKKYGGAIQAIEAIKEASLPAQKSFTLLSETLLRIELVNMSRNENRDYANYNAELDREVALALVDHYLKNVEPADRIDVDSLRIEEMFRESYYTSEEKLARAIEEGKDLSQDPAMKLYIEIAGKAMEFYSVTSDADDALKEPTKTYAAALLEWDSDTPSYPDANMTCRVTYGNVKGYEPKDGVIYKYYTTLKGVIEKEQPGNYEFRVPDRLKEIYYNGDYGQYANENGELVTCFLTNLDITGGNSGSPVLDADGNLIGLAFDGNWEAMSSDVLFEPELQRCICVDIRYVLMIMDKFGGAGYLLDEMNIVRN